MAALCLSRYRLGMFQIDSSITDVTVTPSDPGNTRTEIHPSIHPFGTCCEPTSGHWEHRGERWPSFLSPRSGESSKDHSPAIK